MLLTIMLVEKELMYRTDRECWSEQVGPEVVLRDRNGYSWSVVVLKELNLSLKANLCFLLALCRFLNQVDLTFDRAALVSFIAVVDHHRQSHRQVSFFHQYFSHSYFQKDFILVYLLFSMYSESPKERLL